jgi:hypothetical protein
LVVGQRFPRIAQRARPPGAGRLSRSFQHIMWNYTGTWKLYRHLGSILALDKYYLQADLPRRGAFMQRQRN